MNSYKLFILTIFFSSFLFASAEKNILILNSYHKGFSKSDQILKSIEDVFYSYSQINTDILYMDSKQVYSRDYIRKLVDLYKIQLQGRKYDLVIAIDSFAYLFALKNHGEIFNNGEQILFAGLEKYSKELIKIYNLKSKVSGLIQNVPIEDNIQLIERMIPNLKKLYIINDRSVNGDNSSSFIIKQIKKVKDKYEVEYLRDSSLKEFIKYFNDYKKKQAILFIRYSTDPSKNYYKENEIITALNNFQLPVFIVDDLYLNKGVVGGKALFFSDTGKRIGNMAIDIIYENSSLPIFEENRYYKYIFDYKMLQKYNLKVPQTLNNVEIINKPQSYLEKNRDFINLVFLFSPLLILLIFILTKLLLDKQKSERQLKQRIAFDKVLLNSIQSPTFWQNDAGVILDANKQFCEVIGISYKILIGKTLDYFYNYDKRVRKVIKFLNRFENDNRNSRITVKNRKGKSKTYLLDRKKYFDSQLLRYSTVSIFTDITKEIEYARDRDKQTQYLIQQSKLAEIGEIFSSIAHQWKTPLVEITALAQDMFFMHSKDEKEEDSYHINKIMVQAQYMTKTINEFQDFIIPSKEKTVFSLKTVIKDLLNIVKHNMKYNYIQVDINNSSKKELKIYGFQNEFMQALLNIINNAKEALLKNSEKNRVIQIRVLRKLNYIVIEIIDNGTGIDKKLQKKIFDQYYTTKKEGHGIGLYMTKIIIEDKLDGRIRYKELKNGSCFRVILKEADESISS